MLESRFVRIFCEIVFNVVSFSIKSVGVMPCERVKKLPAAVALLTDRISARGVPRRPILGVFFVNVVKNCPIRNLVVAYGGVSRNVFDAIMKK